MVEESDQQVSEALISLQGLTLQSGSESDDEQEIQTCLGQPQSGDKHTNNQQSEEHKEHGTRQEFIQKTAKTICDRLGAEAGNWDQANHLLTNYMH